MRDSSSNHMEKHMKFVASLVELLRLIKNKEEMAALELYSKSNYLFSLEYKNEILKKALKNGLSNLEKNLTKDIDAELQNINKLIELAKLANEFQESNLVELFKLSLNAINKHVKDTKLILSNNQISSLNRLHQSANEASQLQDSDYFENEGDELFNSNNCKLYITSPGSINYYLNHRALNVRTDPLVLKQFLNSFLKTGTNLSDDAKINSIFYFGLKNYLPHAVKIACMLNKDHIQSSAWKFSIKNKFADLSLFLFKKRQDKEEMLKQTVQLKEFSLAKQFLKYLINSKTKIQISKLELPKKLDGDDKLKLVQICELLKKVSQETVKSASQLFLDDHQSEVKKILQENELEPNSFDQFSFDEELSILGKRKSVPSEEEDTENSTANKEKLQKTEVENNIVKSSLSDESKNIIKESNNLSVQEKALEELAVGSLLALGKRKYNSSIEIIPHVNEEGNISSMNDVGHDGGGGDSGGSMYDNLDVVTKNEQDNLSIYQKENNNIFEVILDKTVSLPAHILKTLQSEYEHYKALEESNKLYYYSQNELRTPAAEANPNAPATEFVLDSAHPVFKLSIAAGIGAYIYSGACDQFYSHAIQALPEALGNSNLLLDCLF